MRFIFPNGDFEKLLRDKVPRITANFQNFPKIMFSVKIFILEPLANPTGQSKEYGYNGYNNTIFFQPILKLTGFMLMKRVE